MHSVAMNIKQDIKGLTNSIYSMVISIEATT